MRRFPVRAVLGVAGGLGTAYIAADERRRRLALRAAQLSRRSLGLGSVDLRNAVGLLFVIP